MQCLWQTTQNAVPAADDDPLLWTLERKKKSSSLKAVPGIILGVVGRRHFFVL